MNQNTHNIRIIRVNLRAPDGFSTNSNIFKGKEFARDADVECRVEMRGVEFGEEEEGEVAWTV
jgi:hypothetical protein